MWTPGLSLLMPALKSMFFTQAPLQNFLLLFPHDSTILSLCFSTLGNFRDWIFLKMYIYFGSTVTWKPGNRSSVSAWRTFAGHHGAGFEAVVAGALEAAHHVCAGAVAAGISHLALVGVCSRKGENVSHLRWEIKRLPKKSGRLLAFASDAADVQIVSQGAFTPERAVCVDALAVDARVVDALINICREKQSKERKTTKT